MEYSNLSLMQGDALDAFKIDFDTVLRDTLTKMLQNNETEGTVTAQLKINLYNSTNDSGADYINPSIKHTVKGVTQAKSSTEGVLFGDYCLEWDKDTCTYILRPSEDAQTSLFDREENL